MHEVCCKRRAIAKVLMNQSFLLRPGGKMLPRAKNLPREFDLTRIEPLRLR